jgi:Ca2+/Na+ antiporter
VIGAAIANILGSFSLGLLFEADATSEFDWSSKLYSLILLALTTLVCPAVYFQHPIAWIVVGIVLVVAFALYVITVAAAISRGVLTAPEDSDSDSISALDPSSDDGHSPDPETASSNGLLTGSLSQPTPRRHALGYHIFYLLFGLVAMMLAGYVLSSSAAIIADAVGLSDLVFGVVILSFATTLPETFVAVMSGRRGHVGILVANTVGSNIFLLSLCLGLVFISAPAGPDERSVQGTEMLTLWASTLALTGTMWTRGWIRKRIAAGMLLGYIAFLIQEIGNGGAELLQFLHQ